MDDNADKINNANPPFYNAILASGQNAFRAYAPQIVPLVVCALFIPFVVAISILAGWLVWKNASVSWEAPIYLQYGCASFSILSQIFVITLRK
jgi:hypothetical protein